MIYIKDNYINIKKELNSIICINFLINMSIEKQNFCFAKKFKVLSIYIIIYKLKQTELKNLNQKNIFR